MRIFLTGASGWIGTAVAPELLAAGHQVTGLARSDAAAAALLEAGLQVRRGSLDDLDSLRAGAASSDAVVHLAFKHDFGDFAGAGRSERAAVQIMLEELAGSDRALLLASGVAMLAPGRVVTERDLPTLVGPDAPRGGTEALAMDYLDRGVRAVSLRFAPSVHGAGDHGFLATLVAVARDRAVAGYVGDGANRWPAVHRSDAARMVALAVDNAPAGAILHAVAEEGITTREIAEGIGALLGLPVASIDPADAAEHFGWIGHFFAVDMPASSALTRQLLDWTPAGPTLLADLASGSYARPVVG